MKKFFVLVALGFASASTFAAESISCVGTEPFWNIDTVKGTLVFSDPDHPDGVSYKISEIRQSEGLPADAAFIVMTGSTRLTAIRAANCSDGASDHTYTHHAIYEIEGRTLYGCCNVE